MMKNIIRILLVITPFLLPLFRVGSDISALLTVVSLLFAILAGFFIATSTSNYLRQQSLIATENSSLISIYKLAKKIQPNGCLNLSNAIDHYMVSILDYDLLDYSQKTRAEFVKLVDEIEAIESKGSQHPDLFPYLHEHKSSLILANQENSLTAKRIVSPLHWFIIGSFAVLTSTLTLALRDSSWASSLISGVLILGVFEVMDLINVVDSNLFLANKLAFENPQYVFQAIERPNYYPEIALKKKWVKNLPSRYRVGIYKNYPQSFEKDIKTVSR